MRIKLFFSFVLFISIHVKAQLPEEGRGFPLIQNFNLEEHNGFVQSWAFQEDSNGVIYVANRLSVFQYKGTRWDEISIKNNLVYSLENHKGEIYIGGSNELGFLAKSDSEESAQEKYYSIRYLLPDSLIIGDIWEVISHKESIFFRSNNFLIKYNPETSEIKYWEPKVRFSFLFELDGEVFVRSSTIGIYKIRGDKLELVDWGNFFIDKAIKSVISIGEKTIFCAPNQCYEKKGNQFVAFVTESDKYLAENYIDEAISLSDESLVFATRRGGVVQIAKDGSLIRIIDEENGLSNNTAYGLFKDRIGDVWVATRNGVSQIKFSLPFEVFDERHGITQYIYDLKEHNGSLYATSSTIGLYKYDVELNEFLELEIDNSGASCRGFLEVQGLLYTVCGGKLYLIRGHEVLAIDTEDLTLSVIELIEPPDLVFTANNLFQSIGRLNEDKLTFLEIENEEVDNFNSIEVDSLNNIWLGSETGGLYRYTVSSEEDYKISRPSKFLTSFTNPEDNKRVLVSEYSGSPIFLTWGAGIQEFDFEENKLRLVRRFGDFFSDTTRQYFRFIEDKFGNGWFRSGSAFQGALKTERNEFRLFKESLNIISDGQNNGIFSDSNGDIWFSMNESLVRFYPGRRVDLGYSYHTQIEEVLVRNDSLINGGDDSDLDVLRYEDNELRFSYSASSYSLPEKTEFRTKLAGFDKDWNKWTSETQKDYTNIPEGEYNFQVQARNVFGAVSEAQSFSFIVLPPWYRTWWAYFMYTIFISGILYTAFKIRVNQILKVERMRTRIANDLHDDVSATLTGISLFAEAVQRDKDPKKRSYFMNRITKSAGDAKENITDIVWAINPENDGWKEFLVKCRRYASDLLESKGIEYTLHIADQIPGKLKMDVRQHLWMIFKEMLTNVVRHSKAERVDVILDVENGVLKLIVQDNGTGFEEGGKTGNGLLNIRKRAEKIKGKLQLETDKEFGTRWRLELLL
ncbi:MAG: hypothetical protein ED557_01850 [Balneola sp.]|nr:MAG: hypothetical protein ED557_01850 [Balneola sp.]